MAKRKTRSAPKGRRTTSAGRLEEQLSRCCSVSDLESLARELLPPMVYDYYAGGAEDELTLEGNRQAFREVFLRPRALVGVGTIDTTTSALGTPVSMPILVAPTAYQKLAHPEGELATTRAAGAAGTLMVASTISTYTLEEIARAATGPIWFQLYVQPDRSISRDLAQRAEAAGYTALCLTVDTPQLGRRERDVRNRFGLPPGIVMANFAGPLGEMRRDKRGSAFAAVASSLLDATLTWDSVSWLRSETKLPVVVKGVIAARDAELAVEAGAAAIIVSNHGGRQLDGCEPTLRALPRVVEAVGGRTEIYMDGGVRRGTDVLKALALGARAVFVGRPILWGLTVGGERGVRAALGMLREELTLAMTLSGTPSIPAIGPELIARS